MKYKSLCEFQCSQEETVFPPALINPVYEVAMVRHSESIPKIRKSALKAEFCPMTSLLTAGLLIIRDRQLLLAYSSRKQCYYLPGGKLDAGETAVQALCREAAEELNIFLRPAELHFYTHITAPAYGETAGTIMEQDCFRVLKPVLPVATAEIEKIDWFTTVSYSQEPQQAPGAVMILARLKADNLID